MISFIEIVSQTFNKTCTLEYKIKARDKNIVEVAFENFSIVIYYCSREYDLGINYYKNRKEYSLEQALLDIGCNSNQLPQYKFMSNEDVMSSYLGEYIALISNNFKKLSNI